jgi:RNA recognition motif-containing protein
MRDSSHDYRAGANKGFCFVEFEELDDCKAAVDNLNLAEVGGLTIRADFARPGQRQNTVHRAVQSNRPSKHLLFFCVENMAEDS